MGHCYQLHGSQPDRAIQVACVDYVRALACMGGESETETFIFSPESRIACVAQPEFRIRDVELRALVDGYTRIGTATETRFSASSSYLMFDNEHHGLICSERLYFGDLPNVTWIDAGTSGSVWSDSRFNIPLSALQYFVMSRVFVPNLEVTDSLGLYDFWFAELENVASAITFGARRTPLITYLVERAPREDLASITAALYERIQALLTAKSQFIDWAEETLVELDHLTQEERMTWKHTSVDTLEASVRCANAMQNAGISTISELVSMTEADLLSLPNFGRKSLREVKDLLEEIGLRLR